MAIATTPEFPLQSKIERVEELDLRARSGTKTFVRLSGSETAKVSAVGNDFTNAATPFEFGPEVPASVLRQAGNLAAGM